MDHYITGNTIKTLREQKKLTQAELGELLGVSPKTISKALGISFLAFAGGDRLQLVKLYAEGSAEARLKMRGHGFLYCYCNKHGLYKTRIQITLCIKNPPSSDGGFHF